MQGGSGGAAIETQPGRGILLLCETEKFPAIALIERGVLCDEIERLHAKRGNILADEVQKSASQPPVPPGLLYIKGADIGGEVLSEVEIMFNHPGTSDDPVSL